jgi:hypothetical protein
MLSYDEEEFIAKLNNLSPMQAHVFAAACAEILNKYFSADIPTAACSSSFLRSAINNLWDSVGMGVGYREDSSGDLARLHSILVGDYGEKLGVGEHVISGIYYAIEAMLSDDPSDAVLVANNLYEAADYAITSNSNFDITATGAEERLTSSPLMQKALGFIFQVFEMVQDMSNDFGELAEVRQFVNDFQFSI